MMKVRERKAAALKFMQIAIPQLQEVFNLQNWRFVYKLTDRKCEDMASIDIDCRLREATIYLNPYIEKEKSDLLLEWGLSLIHELAHCLFCSTWDLIELILNLQKEEVQHYLKPIMREIYERDIEGIAKTLINMEDVRRILETTINNIQDGRSNEVY